MGLPLFLISSFDCLKLPLEALGINFSHYFAVYELAICVFYIALKLGFLSLFSLYMAIEAALTSLSFPFPIHGMR